MDRREKVLGKGYLIKSPVKTTEKSSFSRFWKLRWLVLTEVLFVDVSEFVEDSKLVFSYYKDKDSHAKDEQPKGTLNISQCKSIKSCFQSQANYDHVFIIELNDGKFVRFSAPSCEKKFKWVSLLYKYRFNSNIGDIMSAFGIQGASASRQSNGQNRSSICSVGRSSSFARNHNDHRNGSFDGSSEDPPPLPPRRQSTASGNSFRFADTDRSSMRSALNPSEIDINVLQIFNDLFMFCSKCQSENQKKSSFQKKRRNSSKKWNGQEEDVELRNESTFRSPSTNDGDTISQFSNTSDDFFLEDPCDPYSKIDDILLEKVKDLRERAEQISEGQEEVKDEPKEEEGACKDKEETEDLARQALTHENQAKAEEQPVDDVYMQMNQLDTASILQTPLEREVTNVNQVSADGQADEQEALSSNNVCSGESLQEYFEMSC